MVNKNLRFIVLNWLIFILHVWCHHLTCYTIPGRGGGGANTKDEGTHPLFGQNFPENCMKMKEIDP